MTKRLAPQELPYQEWADTVKARDRYVCVDCGTTGKLHAHHIFPTRDGSTIC